MIAPDVSASVRVLQRPHQLLADRLPLRCVRTGDAFPSRDRFGPL